MTLKVIKAILYVCDIIVGAILIIGLFIIMDILGVYFR